jgi:hypothetical protein
MSEGFLVDRGDHNSKNVQEWIEGEPIRSLWRGLQTKGRDIYKVTTFRCDRCGYLESYAQKPAR